MSGGVEHRLLRCGRFECASDLGPAGVLREEPAGAGGERLEDRGVVSVGREDDDFGAGVLGADASCGLDAVAAGHPQVHENNVGVVFER